MSIILKQYHKVISTGKCLLVIFIGSFFLMIINSCKTTRSLSSESSIDSSLVFSPGGKYASIRIPALIVTKKGTLLAFAEGRIGTASDWSEMDLLMKRSEDGGDTWGTAVIIAAQKKGPTSNPTPIVGNDGTIHLLYQRDYANAYYTSSKDDGKTWSEHTDITYAFEAFKPEYDWKVLAPGPGHSIQLENGRLVVPVWLSDPDRLVPHRSHGPSCVATIYSDDQGKTWKRGDIVANNSPELKSPNESMAVQLDDGRVMLHMRTPDAKRLKAVSYSPDGATDWTKPVFDEELFEPVCMSSLIKVPAKRKSGTSILLFSNPDSRNIPKNPRKNLTIKLSYDQGQSWPVQKVLNEGPSGYSDMAVAPDGTVYCLYETNTVVPGWNYSLMLKKFPLEMLTKSKSR